MLPGPRYRPRDGTADSLSGEVGADVEPRARKRRPKHYTFLSKPRAEARAKLHKGVRA
jgi:hypothetical protein